METGWMKKSLCLACLGLSMVVTAVGTGQTAVGAGQSGTASILNRVQQEDDPELAELFRIAVTNRKNVSEQERLDIVRKVTQTYAQIKLLDQQIEQVAQKIKAKAGPAEMQSELLLTKAELESKRTTELANLREVMGVVPRFPLEGQPVPSLNAWVYLRPIDERVLVFDTLKPFSDYWAMARYKVVGLLSERETLDYIRGRLQDRDSLPLRVNIRHKSETSSAGVRLRDAILSLARETNAQMRTEVRLEQMSAVGAGESPFFLRECKIRTLLTAAVRRPDGGPKLLTSELVDPNEVEQHILWRLTMPNNVPLTFRIEYDEISSKLAKQVADTAKAVAKRLGLTELVSVAGALVEPVPETAFLGRWQAITGDVFRAIDIHPGEVCQVTMGGGSDAIKAGTSIKGTWLPTTKEVIIDVRDMVKDKANYVYRAYVNTEGNLVVERGEIYSQGCFSLKSLSPTILRKVQ